MYARVTAKLFGGPSAPVKIGRYRVLERRGEGAMGVVYAAVDEQLGRKIAIKLLHPHFAGDPIGRARLLREAQAMARLRHENVVLIYDVGTHGADQEQVFIAMELVEGCNLDAWLKQAPRSLDERLAVFLQAGRALAAAHRAGVLHRDFKPENVLVDVAGRARVLDFGLARALAAPAEGDPEDSLSEPLTRTGSILGTPAYMAPEQLRGEPVDARADQFSFCIALYEALYEERPFASALRFEPLQIAAPSRDSRVSKVPRVPMMVRRALLRGLAEDPALRFPDMDALLAALRPPIAGRRGWFAGLLLVGGAGIGAWAAASVRAPGPGMDLARGSRVLAAALEQDRRERSAALAERRSRDSRRSARFHRVLQEDPALASLLLQELGPDEDLASLQRQVLAQPLTRAVVPAVISGALWFDASGALVLEAEDGARRIDRDGRPRPGPAEGPRPITTTDAAGSPETPARSWPGPGSGAALRRDAHGRLFLGRTWLRDHAGEIGAVAWSPDGERVAVGDGAQVRVWAQRGRLLGTFSGHEGTVRLLAWSPEGERLLSGGGDESARVFHLADPGVGQPLRGHAGPISAIAWNPDGEQVATASRDGSVRLWSLVPAARRRLMHPGAVHAIAWHPGGTRLATASDDGKLRIFDLDGDEPPRTLEHGRTALSLAWSPDGQRLASAGGSRLRVWSGGGEPLQEFVPGRRGEDTLAVAWSPSGDLLVAGNDDRLLIFPGGEGPARPVSGPHGPQLRLVFAPDGLELASASVRGAARRWRGDLSAGTAALQESGRLPGEVNDLAWCPDGLLALAREDHRVDLLAGDGLVVLERNTGVAAQSVACDATQLVAGLADGRLRRWWRSGSQPGHDLRGHTAEVDALALGPDGQLLASGDRSGRLYLWAWSDVAIAAAVAEATRMCMSVRQRQALLDESGDEAAGGAEACARRRESGLP